MITLGLIFLIAPIILLLLPLIVFGLTSFMEALCDLILEPTMENLQDFLVYLIPAWLAIGVILLIIGVITT